MNLNSSSHSCYLRVMKSYLLAGRLLHIITLVEVIIAIGLLPLTLEFEPGNNIVLSALRAVAVIYLVALPISAQLDARSRYQNYKQIKDQIFLYGYDERILKPVLKSRCQRDAASLSAIELGFGARCKQYFHANGYRWYHLFPDFVFSKPQFIFTPYFWRTTFFTPRYKSKINYCNLSQIAQLSKAGNSLCYDVR